MAKNQTLIKGYEWKTKKILSEWGSKSVSSNGNEKNNSRVILKIGKDKVETTTDYAFVIGKMEIPNEK